MTNSPKVDERLERVARAMCAAEGLNPDEVVDGPGPDRFIGRQHRGGGASTVFFGPQWETFHKQARAFIAAFDALSQ